MAKIITVPNTQLPTVNILNADFQLILPEESDEVEVSGTIALVGSGYTVWQNNIDELEFSVSRAKYAEEDTIQVLGRISVTGCAPSINCNITALEETNGKKNIILRPSAIECISYGISADTIRNKFKIDATEELPIRLPIVIELNSEPLTEGPYCYAYLTADKNYYLIKKDSLPEDFLSELESNTDSSEEEVLVNSLLIVDQTDSEALGEYWNHDIETRDENLNMPKHSFSIEIVFNNKYLPLEGFFISTYSQNGLISLISGGTLDESE